MTVLEPPSTHACSGLVTGRPRTLLRLEGGVLLIAGVLAFATTEQPWWLVPVLLFLPDLFMAGYVLSSRVGALTYNLGHSYPLPAVLAAGAVALDETAALAVALVWFSHIGMDRLFGYGLKHDDGFSHTHLGVIGRRT